MDTTGGLQTLSSMVAGLNQGLSTFMQNDLNVQMKQRDQDMELDRQEKLEQYKRGLAPSVTLGNLVNTNPQFKPLFGDSADPNTPIPLDSISKLKQTFPDSDSSGSTDPTKGVSIDALDSLLQATDIDDDKRKSIVGGLRKNGVVALPTGVAENVIKNAGGDIKTATAVSILKDDADFQWLSDENKVSRINTVKKELQGKGLQDIPDDQLDTVVQQSADAYQAALAHPDQFPDPNAAVASTLSKRYTSGAVNKVLLRMHSTQLSSGVPPIKKSKSSWLNKLYGD